MDLANLPLKDLNDALHELNHSKSLIPPGTPATDDQVIATDKAIAAVTKRIEIETTLCLLRASVELHNQVMPPGRTVTGGAPANPAPPKGAIYRRWWEFWR